ASMIFSFLGYIGAFAVFATSQRLGLLFVAMFLFSVGEAFRTGTHKAMIFAWLAHHAREDEKIKVYGYTRSWSKIGSAVSVVAAAAMVFFLEQYRWVFLFSIAPYLLNIINFLGYPSYLDGKRHRGGAMTILRTLGKSLRDCFRSCPLRRLLTESMGFEGVYKVSKDYLQPVIHTAVLSLPLLLSIDNRQRTGLMVGAVYFVLFALGSVASRHSHVLADRAGSDERGAHWIWVMNLVFFGVLAGALMGSFLMLAIVGFVVLSILQNFWRPLLIGRVADRTRMDRMATVLSVESQAKSLFAAVLAPLLGLAVDLIPVQTGLRFLPVGVAGLGISAVMLATSRSGGRQRPSSD
ncbi:MAG: hypothetical protein KAJ01_03805, partial [Candidatus Hydrogenedentes bacterium]|nr:hypothetical protein [Candidatus Hydrogenedentota bacterium]